MTVGPAAGAGAGTDSPVQAEPAPLDRTKLAAARLWVTDRYPYLASAVFAAPVLPAAGLGRVVVDRWWRIHADPAVIDSASVVELGGELVHLTSHLLRDHATRADAHHLAEPAEVHHWVDAADAELADDFPGLVRLVETVSPAHPGSTRRSAGRGVLPSWPGPSRQRPRLRERGPRTIPPVGTTTRGPGRRPGPGRRAGPAGITADDQQLIRREVAARLAEAEAGTVSDGLRRWARGLTEPTVNWRVELASVLRRAVARSAGAVDYSYRRPSRRAHVVPGIVLASLARPSIEVAVVCDTSASVTDEQLSVALSEVDGLLQATGTRAVQFLSCDDAVHSVERVAAGRNVTPIGGGGTDLAVGMAAATDQRPSPDVVVVLTDGFTPWPDRPPTATTIVGLFEPSPPTSAAGQPPPPRPPGWARVVAIPAP